MITIYDHIQQLQAELRNCINRRERIEMQAELAKAVAEQALLDCEFERTFEAQSGKGR